MVTLCPSWEDGSQGGGVTQLLSERSNTFVVGDMFSASTKDLRLLTDEKGHVRQLGGYIVYLVIRTPSDGVRWRPGGSEPAWIKISPSRRGFESVWPYDGRDGGFFQPPPLPFRSPSIKNTTFQSSLHTKISSRWWFRFNL